jgi:hypothetical protein
MNKKGNNGFGKKGVDNKRNRINRNKRRKDRHNNGKLNLRTIKHIKKV